MISQLKTVLLLGALTGILLLFGNLLGGTSGLTVAFIIAIFMNVGSYFFSDKIVLAMYRAQELPKAKAPKIHAMVEEIAKKVGIPKPRIYRIPTEVPNAFATGRNPNNAVVAVTDGIVNLLTSAELKGVLAHEIAHVKNRDILISTIAATIASVISYVAFMARFVPIGGRSDNNNQNIISLILLSILAPIAAMIIQLAISRSREYLADESGAKYLKNGHDLASALEKLHTVKMPRGFATQSTAHLFIANPLSGQAFMNLFSTHPDHRSRIAKLRSMKF